MVGDDLVFDMVCGFSWRLCMLLFKIVRIFVEMDRLSDVVVESFSYWYLEGLVFRNNVGVFFEVK